MSELIREVNRFSSWQSRRKEKLAPIAETVKRLCPSLLPEVGKITNKDIDQLDGLKKIRCKFDFDVHFLLVLNKYL